jgi:hypothetical protein
VDTSLLIAMAAIMMTAGIIGAYITGVEIKKNQSPKDTCILCKKILKPNEYNRNVINEKKFPARKHICRNCIISCLDKQNNICPQCKQPLKCDNSMELFLSEWYHPKCAYIAREVRLQKK